MNFFVWPVASSPTRAMTILREASQIHGPESCVGAIDARRRPVEQSRVHGRDVGRAAWRRRSGGRGDRRGAPPADERARAPRRARRDLTPIVQPDRVLETTRL